jgi:ribulose-5-phosphate 4-epimerase/fuculose-1-phosphate aldolase
MKYPRSSYDEMQFARPRHLDRNREHLEEGMPGIPSTSTLVHLGSYNVLETHSMELLGVSFVHKEVDTDCTLTAQTRTVFHSDFLRLCTTYALKWKDWKTPFANLVTGAV